ncbi:MAG: YkgJ family cysteine cluster protein [Proteobacteria bacterium]|nr:YkgJ family cysteine cluster protein [Pseudomonadota bacterium]
MTERDNDGAYVESLPRVQPDESFCFKCHSDISCFNACCADLNCLLTPYDVLRLRAALSISSKEFFETYAELGMAPDTGFPYVLLKMRDDEKRLCPFVSERGCTIYSDRPGACRTYPIGRGASMTVNGTVVEQFVMVREEHCKGFEESSEWTPGSWMKDQGLSPYNAFSDRYLDLVSRWQSTGQILSKPQYAMVYLALYRLDEFLDRVQKKSWLEQFGITAEQQKQLVEDEVERLKFAIKWLEIILFRSC